MSLLVIRALILGVYSRASVSWKLPNYEYVPCPMVVLGPFQNGAAAGTEECTVEPGLKVPIEDSIPECPCVADGNPRSPIVPSFTVST